MSQIFNKNLMLVIMCLLFQSSKTSIIVSVNMQTTTGLSQDLQFSQL